MRYDYSVIRLVPDLARGEFVNVGLIVGGQDGWTIKRMASAGRARHLVNGTDYLAAARTAMDQLADRFEALERQDESGAIPGEFPSAAWLDALATSHRNVVQFTAPAPALADDIDAAVAMLTEQLLVEPEHRQPTTTRNHARAALRRSLLERIPAGYLQERVSLVAGHDQRTTLDFAVRNGVVKQLSHAWSFHSGNVDEREVAVKAWAWVIDTLKDEGGALRTERGDEYEVSKSVDVEVYVTAPADGRASDLESAIATFDRLHIVVHDDPTAIAARAEELLGAGQS